MLIIPIVLQDIKANLNNPYIEFWTPFILKNPMGLKYFSRWKRLRGQMSEILNKEIPWLPFETSDWLESLLNKNMFVFEWGSGGSTLFLLNKVKELVSVEHDKQWFEKMRKKLLLKHKNFHYLLREPIRERRITDKVVGAFRSSSYPKHSFEKYSKVISSWEDNYFDLVIVDGRARNSCIFEAIPKINNNGYLLLDNSEREEYNEGIKLLKDWKRRDFYGPGPFNDYFWQASIFQKPSK